MLSEYEVIATIPVRDMDEATKFYEQILGLKKVSEYEGGNTYESGTSKIFVYASQYAGTNKGTAASWEVENVEATAESLRQKGVTFEKYDTPGMTRRGDVHIMESEEAAWFKDPSGNILSIARST